MSAELEYPDEIDRRLNWPPGTALRLARRRRLPHYLLPDGSIRIRPAEVDALICRVPRGNALPNTEPAHAWEAEVAEWDDTTRLEAAFRQMADERVRRQGGDCDC